jgi:hypothetical protein
MSCDVEKARLFCLSAYVLFVLQFQRAASAAHLQLGAVFTFRLHVLSVSNFQGERVIPDLVPLVNENVS